MENITYDEFIQNILDTRGRFACGDEYHERHHILPRCLGGDDDRDNLIDLYAREHFIAHKLLAKENPDNDKLIYAYWMMAHIGRVEVSAEEYEGARIACSKALSEARQGWYIGENNPNYGNYWTDEQKKHMSEINSNPSQETRDKMSAAGKRRMANPENQPMLGKHHTEEAKRKIGEASHNRDPEVYERISQKAKERFKNPDNHPMFGKHLSEERRKQISERMSGENNPMYGKSMSEERRKQLSDIAKERYKNPEERKKASEAQKKRWSKPGEKERFSGKNSPMFGKHPSEESRDKMSQSAKARCTEEWRQKQSQEKIDRYKIPENTPMFGKHHAEKTKRQIGKTRRENHTCEKIVIQLTSSDEIIQPFWSTRQVERELSIGCGDVSKCCNGRSRSAGGYHWKYLYDNKLKNGEIIPGAITLGLITEEAVLKQLKHNKVIEEG